MKDNQPKHAFETVTKTWQTGDFWSHQPLSHSIKKLVCMKCGLVVDTDSKSGKQRKCVG